MSIVFGGSRLDLDRRELHFEGRRVHLTPKAFELLRILVENRARAVSKTELFERIWPGVFVTDDSLTRLVAEIRGAIGDSARQPTWLRTVHGYGFVLAIPGETISSSGASPRFAFQCGSRQFQLPIGDHVIGRDPASAIPVHSPIVSRRHARVTVTDDRASIEDLDSKNGTFVGDVRLCGRHDLADGDRVRLGDFTLVFSAVVDTATETIHR
jgi:DNA-binding winged helix-turn-helix (wHTH) protein